MKYCPYCGASVLDDTVSFCSECGKSLSISAKGSEKKEQSNQTKKKSSGSPTRLKKKRTKDQKPEPTVSEEKQVQDDGYDGYYNDVIPTDTGKLREGVDWGLMKKIGLVGAGVLAIICLCVAAMYLL